MCVAMYLFTENDVEGSEWDKNNPRMYIQAIQLKGIIHKNASKADIAALHWNESNKNVYYVSVIITK